MIRIFLADDESPARERLKELLQDIAGDVPSVVAGEAANGIEALERLPASGAQVLLLDIRMPGMDGLELARHLSALDNAPAVVFVTAHDKHAIEAFELNALDYLLKPVRAARLAAALKKAAAAGAPRRESLARAADGPREYLSVAERNRIVLVPVRDYNTLAHLDWVLGQPESEKRCIVVLTIRVLGQGRGTPGLDKDQMFSDYEQTLFTRVVAIAERHGRQVTLLVAPGTNIFDALASLVLLSGY